MNPDPLHVEDEPIDIEGGAQAYTAAWIVATVAVLAGLTLAAIAWRLIRG